MQHFPVPDDDSSDSTTKSPRQNPKNKLEDEKGSSFSKSSGQKVDHETMSQNSKADVLNKNVNHRPRDRA